MIASMEGPMTERNLFNRSTFAQILVLAAVFMTIIFLTVINAQEVLM